MKKQLLRDFWLLIITVVVLLSLRAQAEDRHAAVNANIEARYSDCRGANETRTTLRKQVETGKLQRPFFLKLLPQFNTPTTLRLIEKNEAEELAGFSPRNCVEVAEEALPNHHKRYIFRVSE